MCQSISRDLHQVQGCLCNVHCIEAAMTERQHLIAGPSLVMPLSGVAAGCCGAGGGHLGGELPGICEQLQLLL